MYRLLPLVFLILALKSEAQFSSQNINLLARWFNPNEPFSNNTPGNSYSGIWGWHDATKNKEYAILGAATGIYFIDVSNPQLPIMRDFVAGTSGPCTWREIKTYQNYAYVVSDVCLPNTFQIIDMKYLPDSVHVVKNDANLFSRAHALYIDGNKLYCTNTKEGIFGSTPAPIAMFDLTTPENPQLIRSLNQDVTAINYVHDMFVRNDTIYASAGYFGLYVYIFDDDVFREIGNLTQYPNKGFNHSTWLTDDSKFMVMCEESKKTTVKILDVADPLNISVLGSYISNPDTAAIHHNPFVIGNNKVILANYTDGVQVVDFTDRTQPVKTGYFDTSLDVGDSYRGCWGAYPYLPSGIILASDMQNGLFVLDARNALGVKNTSESKNNFSVFPNPAGESITVLNNSGNKEFSYKIIDICGRIIMENKLTSSKQTIKLKNMTPGNYMISICSETKMEHHKILIQAED